MSKQATPTARRPRVAPATPRTPLVILGTFIISALALGWLLTIPFVLMTPVQREEYPLGLVYNLFILTPAVAALIAYLMERRHSVSVLYTHAASTDEAPQALRPQNLTDALGITPLRPVKRLLGWSVLALLLFFGLSMAALPLGAALGVYPFDSSLPVFVQALEYRLGQDPTEFIATGLLVEVLLIFGLAAASVFLHAGQEMGWRGYLFPRVQLRWGTGVAVLISGAAAGLWHAPLLALGFFYAQTPLYQALGLMVVYSIIIGGVLAWLRMRADSIWPAAFAQSMITAAAILHYWFTEMGEQIDFRQATLQGWSGWLLPAVLLAVLLLTRHRSFTRAGAADAGVERA